MSVTGQDIVDAARQLLGVWYVWWQPNDPIPMWSYDYPNQVPPWSWFDANGTMCSDLVNAARMECGLESIGGTPAYYDWLLSAGTGEAFDPSTEGVPGAICVNPGVWRGGSGQGHIACYTDSRTLIQATDGQGNFAGVNEGEQDYDSYKWANYWLYGLMPDVDYSEYIEPVQPGHENVVIDPSVNWFAIASDGVVRLGGENVDWSGGWIGQSKEGWLRRIK